MKQEVMPGKFAGWIAPPKTGIDNKPGNFEYVKIT
jgi:benzoyl-CoA 2,3-dioxygenase component B